MDPFEEFEFKPLTNGLGFHKKTVSLKEGLQSSGVLEDELRGVPNSVPQGLLEDDASDGALSPAKRHTFEDVLSALEKTPLKTPASLDFTEPLPREPKKEAMEVEIPRPVQSPFPQPGAYKAPTLKKIPTQTQLADVGTRRGAADSPQRKLIPASFSFSSAVLDLIIVSALSLIFLTALLTVTKIDLAIVLKNLNQDLMTRISLGVLFIAVMQMYAIVARAFFGRTLGEWTFDFQLGRDDEQLSTQYPIRIVFRSLLNTLTGLIGMPCLSALLGYDLAGRLTGVQLYRQRE